MPLPEINLDTRTAEQLFLDARRRIPVYAPEWTDHNETDPGIAFLQLVAWLQEMILWRVNRVPDKTFVKFLELVGIELQPPSPARAKLTFKLSSKDLSEAVPILKGTQVTLAGASAGAPVIFETDDNLSAIGADILAVQSYDAARFQLFPVESHALPGPVYPFSPHPQDGCAFAIGFDRRFPQGVHRLLIQLASDASAPAVRARGTGRDGFSPPVRAVWEYSTGDPGRWGTVSLQSDETRSFTRSGYVLFDAPEAGDFAPMLYGLRNQPGQELFWVRYRIAEVLGAGYETPPVVEGVLVNTIDATNAVTVRGEVVGASNGLPNQEFRLANSPVLPPPSGVTGRVEICEEENGPYERWIEVKDFDSSSREDRHYTLDASTGVVRFGDGRNGKIPRALSFGSSTDAQAFERNIRMTEYRWGGGIRANAGARTITSLLSSVAFVESVTNLQPSFGGDDEETLDKAKERAPMTIRTMSRAVTPEDFAFLARQTPGAQIRRAKAFPLLRPDQRLRRSGPDGTVGPELPIPGVITVVVVPESTDPKPLPSDATLQLVADWLDRHRLLTSELYVARPRYRQIHVRAQVIAKPSADSGIVERQLRQRLLDYFHPLHGGRNGAGWDFGQSIDFSETYGRILETDGVLRIRTDSFETFVDDEMVEACKDFALDPDELAYSVDHEIEVTYE